MGRKDGFDDVDREKLDSLITDLDRLRCAGILVEGVTSRDDTAPHVRVSASMDRVGNVRVEARVGNGIESYDRMVATERATQYEANPNIRLLLKALDQEVQRAIGELEAVRESLRRGIAAVDKHGLAELFESAVLTG